MHVVLTLVPGGTERLVLELVRRSGAGVEAEVCCLDERGRWGEELRSEGIPVHLLGRQPGFHPSLALQLARLTRERGIDLIHCHQYTPFVYGALAAFFAHRSLRLVFTEHGRLDDSPPSAKRRWANRVLGRGRGRFFAVCEDLRTHMLGEGFSPERLDVIYNGIDLGGAPSTGDRDEARRALGIEGQTPVVGTVARLNPVKDLPTLIEAVQGTDAHLVIVGDGEEREKLEAMANEQVHLLGFRDDVRALLPGFDVFVNSSRHEGVSLTIVEAMATELPVIATRVGGTPEVVDDGVTGLLVPPGDPVALRNAIGGLLGDREKCTAFGAAGRVRAIDRFSLESMIGRYRAVYESNGSL
ncbi:MAG: glycosyltransferase [Planctomycetota bacterium]|jgi:glycosyltransferase involved in cell wall biosynthesis